MDEHSGVDLSTREYSIDGCVTWRAYTEQVSYLLFFRLTIPEDTLVSEYSGTLVFDITTL